MSDIVVRFKPENHRELIRAIQDLKKAQGKHTRVVKTSTAVTKKQTKANHGLLTSNRLLTNSFATMRSHLLLYSFAMSMGIRQTIQLAKEAGRVKSMETAFMNLSGGTENASISMTKLQMATNGTMSQMDLLQQANSAMVLGVTKNSDEMSEMFDMAQRLGRALGVDTARSIESLVTGLGRQSVKMLDNIGIIVKSNDAYEDYAKKNDLVASKLTDSEKRQAFFNAALESGRKKIGELGPEIFTIQDSFDRFKATIDDLGIAFGKLVGPGIQDMMDTFSDFMFDMSAGPTEKLVKNLEEINIKTSEFQFLTKLLNEELRDKAMAEATAASGAFVGQLVDQTGSLKEAEKFLEKFNLTTKTVQTSQDFLQASFRSILPLWKAQATSIFAPTLGLKSFGEFLGSAKFSVVDFQGATKETMLLVEAESKKIEESIQHRLKILNSGSSKEYEAEKKRLQELYSTGMNANLLPQERRLFVHQGLLDWAVEMQKSIDLDIEKQKQIQALIPSLAAYIGEQELLKKSTGNSAKIFATELKLLDKKAILEQKLADKTAELQAVLDRKNKTELEKKESDAEAIKLKEEEIALSDRLTKMKEQEAEAERRLLDVKIDAHKKAFSKVGDLAKKGAKQFGAGAKATANIEATMAIINAIGSGLKIKNSKMMKTNPISTGIYALATVAEGLVQAALIREEANKIGSAPTFAEGGYVGGRSHSQGGTMIEAERGEFVMSRNAVESIGLETLNQMNQSGGGGSINVSVSGNVLTQDFVEGELAESIKEAVRRGSDFGLS